MNDLAYLGAREALDLFGRRELSPVELLDALMERIEAVDGRVNAVCDRRYDEARAEATESERRYAGHGEVRALEGLPVAVKEEQPMAGRSWTFGSMAYEGNVAEFDHPVVERIQAAGGVVHIRTTTPEFSCAGFTDTTMWGTTRNPWNLDYTPGGSSGGSGAALAAGYAPLATGSDIGGSIRIPSTFNGTVGFKPPYGRVPALPPYNLDDYCHDGPMARTVADTALLSNVISGRHPLDVVSLPDPPHAPMGADDIAGMKVALCMNLGDFPVEPEVAANTRRVAEALAAAGAEVVEVELPWSRRRIFEVALAHFGAIMGPATAKEMADKLDLLMPYTRAFIDESTSSALDFVAGLEAEAEVYAPLGMLLAEHEALLCPTSGSLGLPADEYWTDRKPVVDGVELEHYLLSLFTVPFNIASRCPVLAVPSGIASNGVPTGVQIVGRTYDDPTVFRLGHAVEAAIGGFRDPSWRPSL